MAPSGLSLLTALCLLSSLAGMSFAQPTDLASWEFVYLPASPDSALPQEPPPEIAGWRSMGEWSAADFTPDLEYWVRTRLPDDLVAPSSFIVSGR